MYFFPSVYKNRAIMWHDYSLGFGTICLAAATIATKAIATTVAIATTEIETATTFKAPITESSGAINFLSFGK